MIRKRIRSWLLSLQYLRLRMEIHVLTGLTAIRRDQNFRRARP